MVYIYAISKMPMSLHITNKIHSFLVVLLTYHFFQSQLATSPANFPLPIINNEPVAPILNTIPSQTRAHENHLLISMEQQLQQQIAAQQIQIMQQQQEIEAARHFGRL